jgi:ribosome-associated toxin RatA of RatAB toxin-antitoxin module
MAAVRIWLLSVALAVSAGGAETSTEEWSVAKQANGVTIFSRAHNGSKLQEFKAVGEIDASSKTVHAVIDDVESYANFMPYTAEARVLKRDADSLITYQRISPKIVGDRDYTLRIDKKSWPEEFGMAYLNEWKPANELGPAEKPGVFRVKVVSGSWLLEPSAANKTRATYFVFTDSGIAVPQFLANTISATGILKLFAAVRKQAKELKYQTP